MDANKIREIRIIRENPRFRRYSEYKESGVEWIEEIPNHWRYSRLKFHLTGNSGGIWGEDDEFGNGTYVLRSTEITIDGHWDLQNLIKRKLSKEEAERFLLKKGDLIITKSSGSQNHIGKTGLVNETIEAMVVCYSNFVQRLRPQSHINSKFLHYFMNCPLAREQYKYQSETTTGLANLNAESINHLFISVPPEQEQKQIANFLDRKTEQIDELIHLKERRIELLQAQRTALINQAVTKGLDPNVEMKPSEVEWIGEIPKDWEIVRSKHLFGNRNQRDYEGEPLLSVTQDRGILPRNELDYRVWNPAGDIRSYKLVRPGDWVISLRTFEGGIELSEVRGIVSAAYTTMFPRRQIFNSYFKHLLKSVNFIAELNRITTGIRQGKNISYEDFSDTRIAFPSLSEQTAIGNFLDHKTQQIDELIATEQRKIELLKEYRQSLISEAVTGKIDVRNEV